MNDFTTGQVVRHSSLSLYDAMSAFELMDPKMDAGVRVNDVLILEEGLESESLKKPSELSAAEMLGLMDKLLELELLWYAGNPISQSLLTCLYIHNVEKVVDEKYLKCFFDLLLNRASCIRQYIMNADVYHEEDFVPHLFGFSLPSPDVPEKTILAGVKDVESELSQMEAAGIPLDARPEGLTKEILSGILLRLRLSKSWYSLQKALLKPECRGLPAAKKLIATIRNYLSEIEKTNALGQVPTHSVQPEICRRLVHATHPRTIHHIPFAEHVAQFQKTLNHLEILCDITTYDSFEKLGFLITWLSDQGASIWVRSTFINLSILDNKIFGIHSYSDFVKGNAKDTFEIPDRYFRVDLAPEFFSNMEKMFLKELLVLAANKARRRRKLTHLMREWSYLVEDGDALDSRIAVEFHVTKEQMTHFYYCWTIDKVLKMMILWLKLGFELELYDPYEDHMLFWYMDELYTQRLRNHHYILTINHGMKLNTERNTKKKKINNNKTLKNAKDKVYKTHYHLELQMEAQLTKAIYFYLSALHKEGKLPKQPQFPFGSPSNRFMVRFEPFFKLRTPPGNNYAAYQSQNDFGKLGTDTILKAATTALQSAKAAFEKYSNLQNDLKAKLEVYKLVLKVTITNSVHISMLSKDLNWSKKGTAKISYNIHPHFPVITL
uniref:Uncharacterized protein n=1 Tax=Arcella intermedia TaxID=1963864 RepID=A0A6B2KZ51_9EUKA